MHNCLEGNFSPAPSQQIRPCVHSSSINNILILIMVIVHVYKHTVKPDHGWCVCYVIHTYSNMACYDCTLIPTILLCKLQMSVTWFQTIGTLFCGTQTEKNFFMVCATQTSIISFVTSNPVSFFFKCHNCRVLVLDFGRHPDQKLTTSWRWR